MNPEFRPKGLITLINRSSTTFYSGMMPGVLSKRYFTNEALINIRFLADRVGVDFICAEINGLDVYGQELYLEGRPSLSFSKLSLDVGSEIKTNKINSLQIDDQTLAIPIKPFYNALRLIEVEDDKAMSINAKPFSIIGSGLSGLEVAFALRHRWPMRSIQLYSHSKIFNRSIKVALREAKIQLKSNQEKISSTALICTGSKSPQWLQNSNLLVDSSGRVLTTKTLQVINYPNIFAAGDCGVISGEFRPPSGVWAVRAAQPLAENIERSLLGLSLRRWSPQKWAMQLVGGFSASDKYIAWCFLGGLILGPTPLLWNLKESIDRRFMEKFSSVLSMNSSDEENQLKMECRGCAAKIPEQSLKDALSKASLPLLATDPEDASFVGELKGGKNLLQSVDGFPALVADPWLNARLTTLHACSDLWASGAFVSSAQALITLPAVSSNIQKELLIQILHGIQSVLTPQGAKLIGGHTMESRNSYPISTPISLSIEISLSVNGIVENSKSIWSKSGLEDGDDLLISRPLGTGVLFAGLRKGIVALRDFEKNFAQINASQDNLLKTLIGMQRQSPSGRIVHACTDITGFGLLGHLGEMINSTNKSRKAQGLSLLRINLFAFNIPVYVGVFDLFEQGCFSTLAPYNRKAWKFLQPSLETSELISLDVGTMSQDSEKYKAIMELIVDPQTCGPLVLACSRKTSIELMKTGSWSQIGKVVESY